MKMQYLITFKPYSTFFFGTFKSFGEGYYAESSRFPLQTSIVGCLRKTILKQNGWLDQKGNYPDKKYRNQYEQITGSVATVSMDSSDLNLGIIEKVSPVFIVRQAPGHFCPDDFLFPVPQDIDYQYDPVEKDDKGNKVITGFDYLNYKLIRESEKEKAITSRIRNPKNDPPDYLGDRDFWEKYIRHEEIPYHPGCESGNIFLNVVQQGIARDENRQTVEGAFYEKHAFCLAKGYSFGVIAVLNGETPFKKEKDDVFLGGDRSLFQMQIKPITAPYELRYTGHPVMNRILGSEPHYEPPDDDNKYVCISALYGDQEPLDLEHALILSLEANRFLEYQKKKTDSYCGIPHSSVLYPKKGKSFIYKGYDMATKIGYNFIIKAKKGF